MKSRETKAKDLAILTESLQNSTSAMVVSFNGVTVTKDQEFRSQLREAGAKYQVVKNTLARIAVKGTQFEDATESLKGVTAIAWTDGDPVVLSKAVSKFMKENDKIYTFKTGVVDGKLVNLEQLTTIANLPSKEELISKLLFVLNAQAQRIVTVINAVPRDLAVVIKQIGEQEGRSAGTPAVQEAAPVEETSPAVAVESDGEAAQAPVEQAEEAQESRENDQDPGSPEGEQAAVAAEEAPAEEPAAETEAPAEETSEEEPAA